jgi:hypothetical protein
MTRGSLASQFVAHLKTIASWAAAVTATQLTTDNAKGVLPCVHFYGALAFPTTDAAIFKIDTLNCPSFAGEVDYAGARAFGESMAHSRAEFLVVGKGYDHVRYFDRRVFDSDLKLPKSSFFPPNLDPIVIASKVYFPRAQAFPTTGILRGVRQSGHNKT